MRQIASGNCGKQHPGMSQLGEHQFIAIENETWGCLQFALLQLAFFEKSQSTVLDQLGQQCIKVLAVLSRQPSACSKFPQRELGHICIGSWYWYWLGPRNFGTK